MHTTCAFTWDNAKLFVQGYHTNRSPESSSRVYQGTVHELRRYLSRWGQQCREVAHSHVYLLDSSFMYTSEWQAVSDRKAASVLLRDILRQSFVFRTVSSSFTY